jgi:plasmid stabilization system protein ParE
MTPSPGDEEADRVYAVRLDPRARADIDAAHVHFAELSGDAVADEWQNDCLLRWRRWLGSPRGSRLRQKTATSGARCGNWCTSVGPGSVAYRVLFTINRMPRATVPSVYILHIRHGAARPMTRAEARRIEGRE